MGASYLSPKSDNQFFFQTIIKYHRKDSSKFHACKRKRFTRTAVGFTCPFYETT